MAQHFALPGEVAALRRYLAPLPAHRVEPVLRFLIEVVGECPMCDSPITRTDPRRLVDGRLLHLACSPRDSTHSPCSSTPTEGDEGP